MSAEAFLPPPRKGVNASRVRAGAGPYADVLAFLQARFPHAPDWPARLLAGDSAMRVMAQMAGTATTIGIVATN